MGEAFKKIDSITRERRDRERRQTLERLAQYRVTRAVKAVSLCGNLISCKPTDADKRKITLALRNSVKSVSARFRGVNKAAPEFYL